LDREVFEYWEWRHQWVYSVSVFERRLTELYNEESRLTEREIMIWRIPPGSGSPLLVRLIPSLRATQITDKPQVQITGTTALVAMSVPPKFNMSVKSN
jgi:hypothetical protein